ncbi:hypothetical protein QZH41_006809 [Actinostola sp. cb2023]|nr:hypothetical protein QZH41_006809 [Actinostola sp. cb2023]
MGFADEQHLEYSRTSDSDVEFIQEKKCSNKESLCAFPIYDDASDDEGTSSKTLKDNQFNRQYSSASDDEGTSSKQSKKNPFTEQYSSASDDEGTSSKQSKKNPFTEQYSSASDDEGTSSKTLKDNPFNRQYSSASDDEGTSSKQSKKNPFTEQETTFYANKQSTPYLYKGKYALDFDDKIRILLLDVDTTKICTQRPNAVQENAFFVIDRSTLKNASDWLMTDIGAFDNRGGSARIFHVENNTIAASKLFRGRKSEIPKLREGDYLIRNVFYRHKKYHDFLRTATILVDCNGDDLQLGLIEYKYAGEEHHVSPHKNPRTGNIFVPTAPSTREAIKHQAKGHKGPSTIYDEAVENAGGIFDCPVMADMPRDIKQVKNARQCLQGKARQDEFPSLLGLSREDQSVRNLQWTPSPRVVYCTEEQINEIISECCGDASQSILSIDTTYNVGEFYVTSTTYQSSKFIHSRTGKPAILPGPVMFHIRRTEKDFKYFIYTLLEQNDKLERVAFVGGDRDKAQQGFTTPLKRCTFLPCKKHVEDDITRKLSDIGLSDIKSEILTDIFGSEKNKEKGIIDSTCEDEFLAKLISATEKWDMLEREKDQRKAPQFSVYFRKHIKDDMRDGMLLHVRRRAGLEDDFFYNNGQECSNFKYKSKIREQKMEHATGYRPKIKCTWVEAITIYKEMVEEVNRNKQRSVLKKGPYLLSTSHKHLEVSLLKWSSMTTKEKQNHVKKVDGSCKKLTGVIQLDDSNSLDQEEHKEEHSDELVHALGKFEDSNLPEFLRGSWKNAASIIQLSGIGPFPNDSQKMSVISLTSPITHTVQMRTNGKFECDQSCPRFKECSICAHTIAVASHIGKLKNFVTSYEAPLDRMVRAGIPGGSGKKENEKKRKRHRVDHKDKSARDVTEYGERVGTYSPQNEEEDNPYELVFINSTAATTCYGCKGRVRDKPSSPPPPPPYDIFVRHRERRVYKRVGETKIRIGTKPEMVYFHPVSACCSGLSKSDVTQGKLVVSGEVKRQLNNVHKQRDVDDDVTTRREFLALLHLCIDCHLISFASSETNRDGVPVSCVVVWDLGTYVDAARVETAFHGRVCGDDF